MAGSPVKRSKLLAAYDRIQELERENERLHAQLGHDTDYVPLYQSAMGIPELEGMLDSAIVTAIITHRGNVYNVLRALDYDVRTMSAEARRETVAGLLNRPGVRTALEQGIENLENIKNQVIAKQISSALEGDESTSLAASNFLARIGGWVAPTKLHVSGKVEQHNIYAFLNDPNIMNALDKLDHEPGEAVAVQSEAHDALQPAPTYEQDEE